jgi:hypothetical protein
LEKDHCLYNAIELFDVEEEEWEQTNHDTIFNLIDSMPSRMQDVIEAE